MGTSASFISTHQIAGAVPSLLSYHFKKTQKKICIEDSDSIISHTNKNRKTNADHLETEIKYFVFIL